MITKVVIRDAEHSPLSYLSEVSGLPSGKVIEFKPGPNVIVGRNGSGKTTLLKLIERYLLVGAQECEAGRVRELFDSFRDVPFLDGIDVCGDYKYNVFRMAHSNEMTQGEEWLRSIDNFGATFQQKHSSTGEGVNIAFGLLLRKMFSPETNLKFPIDDRYLKQERYTPYLEYVKSHRVDCEKEITVLVDEPDRNLDIENAESILNILSLHKEQTQMIAVVHNPLLICSLSKCPDVNIIELTDGYVESVRNKVNKLIGNNEKD